MVKIRLARVGKKKQPTYRFVVSDSHKDLYGKYLEIVGHYNPFTKVCEVNKDRILFWIGQGAQVSPTVHNLLVDQNVIQEKKVKASKPGKKKEEAKPAPSVAAPEAAAASPTKDAPAAEEKPAEPAA
jgi:small subunit ribosomal protein S16